MSESRALGPKWAPQGQAGSPDPPIFPLVLEAYYLPPPPPPPVPSQTFTPQVQECLKPHFIADRPSPQLPQRTNARSPWTRAGESRGSAFTVPSPPRLDGQHSPQEAEQAGLPL